MTMMNTFLAFLFSNCASIAIYRFLWVSFELKEKDQMINAWARRCYELQVLSGISEMLKRGPLKVKVDIATKPERP